MSIPLLKQEGTEKSPTKQRFELESNLSLKGEGDNLLETIRKKMSFEGSENDKSAGFLNLHLSTSQVVHVKTNKESLFSNNLSFSYLEIIGIIFSNAVPSAFSLFFIFIAETLNILFISVYKDGIMLTAVGIGTLYINTTGYLLGIGLLGGLDTICSHSFGAGHYKLIGIYTNISRIVSFCFFIVICLPMAFFCESILLGIGQNPEVSVLSAKYVKSMMPAIFFALQFYSSQRYLQSMNIFLPAMIVTLITAAMHVLWCWLFIIHFDYELGGAAICLGITELLNLILITIYISCLGTQHELELRFSASGISLKRILDFLKLGVPAAILFAANWLGVEVMTLLSSYLNFESLIANVCLLNLTTLVFMIPMGISYAMTLLIGQAIGASNVHAAKMISVIGLFLGLLFMGVFNFFIHFYRDSIPFLYTDNPQVVAKITELINIYVFFGIIDTLQIIFNGIIKGLGKQKMTSIIVLIVLYPVNIPMSYMFGFVINYGLIGLWYSQLTSIVLLAISYVIILLCLDWEDISKRSVINMQLISDQLEKYGKGA